MSLIAPENMFLSASDVTDFTTGKILRARIEAGVDTFSTSLTLVCNKNQWRTFFDSGVLQQTFLVTNFGDNSGLLIAMDTEHPDLELQQYASFRSGNSGCSITANGSLAFLEIVREIFLKEFKESQANLDWIYSTDGASITVPIREDRMPISEMYSFLGDETLEQYYDRYMKSDASILLLIGPPGTGKTSFIRGLLQHSKTDAMVTYDPMVLSKDYVFASFVEGDANVFIIEDADLLLGSRKEGNDLMHKFLNVGDGLVTTAGKKMIFSTNLESVKDIDPALTRPGRCFDVVHFGRLPAEQAEKCAEALGIPMPEAVQSDYSLAELFHTQVEAPKTKKKTSRSVGFF